MAPAAIIIGSVVDPSGRPVPQARAFFSAAPAEVPDIAALADEAGGFVLSAPQPGEYTVSVIATGFVASSTQVNAIRSRDTTMHVVLEPDRQGNA